MRIHSLLACVPIVLGCLAGKALSARADELPPQRIAYSVKVVQVDPDETRALLDQTVLLDDQGQTTLRTSEVGTRAATSVTLTAHVQDNQVKTHVALKHVPGPLLMVTDVELESGAAPVTLELGSRYRLQIAAILQD